MAEIRIPFAQNPLAVSRAPLLAVEGLPGMSRIDPGAAAAPDSALGDAARQVGQFVEAERRAMNTAAIGRARVAYSRGLGELEIEFQGRDLRDSGEAATEFRRRAMELAGRVGEGLPGGEARRAWQNDAETILGPREFNVRRDAFERGRQGRVADIQSSLETWANQAALARNPVERETAMGLGRQAIAEAVAAGDLNPAAQRQLEDRFQTQVSTAAVVRAMQANPGAAIAMLNDPTQTPGLDADRRASLTMQAMNRSDALAARAEAALGRRERAVGAELQQVNGLLASGIVPEDRIAGLRDRARGTAYERIIPLMVDDARQVGRFAVLPFEQQVTELQGVQQRVTAGTATDADLAQQQRLTGVIRAQQRDLDENGVGGAVGQRILGQLPALDFANADSINARVAAAQTLAQHAGRPVSALTREETTQMVRQFTEGAPERRLAMVQSVMQIADPTTRAETIRQIERARGDAGRMAPGTLALIADMARGGPEGQRRALQAITDLTADVSDRVRQPGERAQIQSALQSAMGSGHLRVLVEQRNATGDGRFAAAASAELDRIEQMAATRMAAGVDAETAVRQSVALLRGHRATLEDSGRAMVSWPTDSGLSVADMRRGLDALRQGAAGSVTVAEGEAGAGDAGRRRQTAIRQGVWVNEGDRFSLIYRSGDGSPVVLAETTIDGIRQASRGVVERDRVAPPPVRAERAIQDEARQRRTGAVLAPVDVPTPPRSNAPPRLQ